MTEVCIDFELRRYQEPFYDAIVGDEYQNAIAVWHRRAGKDEIVLQGFRELSQRRIGTYWHCLPEYEQARKAIWNAVIPNGPNVGRKRIEAVFPPEAGFKHNASTMLVTMPWGSTYQLIGSDNYNATVGSGPVGIAYSEWALANPSAYAYHMPMLRESRGKAVFITTPRGNNHAKATLDMAKRSSGWFWEVLDVRDTKALTEEELVEELDRYQALWGTDFGQAYFEQEYLCSFAGAMVGAYFGAEIARAERDGRVCPVAVDWSHPVHTAWDLGKAVNNPIWCFQVIGSQLRVVDFYQPDSLDIVDWCAWLKDKGYHGIDYVPHDIIATEWGSSRTRLETLFALGRRPQRLAQVAVADGLQAGRTAINAAVIDDGTASEGRTILGIDGLKNYRREWDDELKRFRDTPLKDWSEHIGSAWRYLGLAYQLARVPEPPKPKPKAAPGQVYLPGPPEPARGYRIKVI